jgi:DNA gyrase subunit A
MALMHEEIRKRYLSYAMSVITSRAIPDVRDGLKPVQRRILYAMYNDLKLSSSAKYRKNAAIVGRVMAAYHPHGDQSIADTLVRMAQDFSMRYPLVDGHGNYGSIDGDGAAAMRYIEARLAPMAERLLEELKDGTVDFRTNFDNTEEEPDVLPAQVPNLLLNGGTGIAVGMATNIPPHNAKEVLDACIDLISNPTRRISTLVKHHIKGPDFPTGGVILENQDEITSFYEEGQGSFTIRAKWEIEDMGRGKKAIIITEIPYAANKSSMIEKIASHVATADLPQVTDVRDESTDEVRIVLELKRGADHEAALAYLFKKTPLEDRFHMNLTCLFPTDELPVPEPKRADLKEILQAFLDFRFEVTTRRLQHQLDGLERRIHVLEAYEVAFSNTQKLLKIVQSASSKGEARTAVKEAFDFDEDQAEAIISLPIYRLANTEKQSVLDELAAKRSEAKQVRKVLDDDEAVWSLIRSELRELSRAYGDKRRTSVEVEVNDFDFNEEDYIESEDVNVIVSRDGWVRTQKSYGDLTSLRCRDNDEIGWVLPGNTKDTALFFTSAGKCYTARVADLPLTTGYGDPIQAMFSFEDGERVVNVVTIDDLVLPASTDPVDAIMLAVTKSGSAVRFDLEGFTDPSTTVGRTYQRLDDDDAVINCCLVRPEDYVVLATHGGRGTTFDAEEVKLYKGAGKGVKAISLADKDEVLAYTLCGENQGANLHVETNRGAERMVTHQTYKPTKRGNKGYQIIKRGHLIRWNRQPVEIRQGE